jgi:hypothetical protein
MGAVIGPAAPSRAGPRCCQDQGLPDCGRPTAAGTLHGCRTSRLIRSRSQKFSTGRYLPREEHIPDRKSEHGRIGPGHGHGHGLLRTVAVAVAVADPHRVPISGFSAGR